MFKRFILFITAIITCSTICFSRSVSPTQFGLNEAKTGEERYNVLYRVHVYALEHNATVNYAGIKDIHLTIPKGAKSIPLCDKTDFKGCRIQVINEVVDNFPLFVIKKEREVLNTNKYIGDLNTKVKGISLLMITDNEPWINERQGYGHTVIRKEILFCNNGRIKTSPIAPYSDKSSVKVELIRQVKSKKYFRNISFTRDEKSTRKALLLGVDGVYNYTIENVKVYTPEHPSLFGDAVISICNSYDIHLNDIEVEGTYSFADKYGYAFSLNNISQLKVDNVRAIGRWGVFCCNNLNGAIIRNCQINRFDIHCYGRDFSFYNCTFTKTGLPMSSFYGTAYFNGCTFDNAISIIHRIDYNAYTPFDVIYENCVFNLDSRHNYLIDLVSVPEVNNTRPELSKKNLPNATLKDCRFFLEANTKEVVLYKNCPRNNNQSLGYISTVNITGLTTNQDNVLLTVFDAPIKPNNTIALTIEGQQLDQIENKNYSGIRAAVKHK